MLSNIHIQKFKANKLTDSRGHLKINFEDNGIIFKESISKKNVFRGLHIQTPPCAQTKYIWVEKGSILDIVLDLDSGSKSFGIIKNFKLNSKSGVHKISKNLAHGFISLEPTIFKYICVGNYNDKLEKTIVLQNEYFSKIGFKNIHMSDKDKAGIQIEEALKHFKSIKW